MCRLKKLKITEDEKIIIVQFLKYTCTHLDKDIFFISLDGNASALATVIAYHQACIQCM